MGFEIENGVLVKYTEEGASTVTIPKGVAEIGEGAFAGCKNLVVTVPKQVFELVGEGVFKGCKYRVINS